MKMHLRGLSVLLMLVLSIVFVERSLAQEQAPAADAAATTESVVAVEQPADAVTVSTDGNVSIDFRDADIRNVLQILSYKSGVNIVAGPEVSGIVTIQLKDVPWQQALDVVLQTYGFASEKKGKIIVVTTVENLKKIREDSVALAEQEPLETRTYVLNFAKASEVIQSIDKMKSDRGKVDFDQRTNTIILTDVAKKLDLIDDVIKQLDMTTPLVLIEAKIVETTFSDRDNLGVDWTVKATITGAERPSMFPFTASSSNKYLKNNAFPAADSDDFTYGTLNFNQLQAVFEALKSRSNTNILSSPRISTVDNKTAQIVVGTQYPIPSYTYNEEQARLQVSGWEYKDIGIIFNVTPHVNKAGYVSLDVEPRITDILDFVTVENTSLPRLSNESAKTSVIIKDADTLVIGGLVKNQKTDTKRKVPILGDLPLIGLAFQKSEVTDAKTDLLIFITPHIITPEIPKDSE